jgi:hypothetical protein
MASGTATESNDEESFGTHLRKLDHWTFLLALGLVVANIAVNSAALSAAAAALLLIALGYDAWEFYAEQ